MKHITAATLLLLTMAPIAHAAEVTDDTPARIITIPHDGGRAIVSIDHGTMSECKEAIKDNLEETKSNYQGGFTQICVPTDMTADERITYDLPNQVVPK